MKFLILTGVLLISFVGQKVFGFTEDSSQIIKIKYSKKELQKEIKDLKNFEAQLKIWKKAVKENNPDYLNEVYDKTLNIVNKEHSELSTRISERSKKLIVSSGDSNQKNSKEKEDLPKVYNSELKDQIVHVNKSDILQKKAESDYLNKYIHLIRNEKNILNKLEINTVFTSETKPDVFHDISNSFNAFKNEMKAEIELIKKETSKK